LGVWKMNVTCRIKGETRVALLKHAAHERRTLSNLMEVLLEWSVIQLEKRGSTERLLRRKAQIPRNPDGNYKRKQTETSAPSLIGRLIHTVNTQTKSAY
jgi:hypothetical protein